MFVFYAVPMNTQIAPPSLFLLAAELRVFPELGAWALGQPWLRRLPRGDGHSVLVIPGFGADDLATFPLRHTLGKLGYQAKGWKQGRNLGMNAKVRDGLKARLDQITTEGPASLIGWSLGGVFARELARKCPQQVRQVITLGSPINHAPDATNVDALFKKLNPGFQHDFEAFRKRCAAPPVPCAAIHTKSDGIVSWRTSLEDPAPNTQNIEVFSSHFGLVANPLVLRQIAQLLAQPKSPVSV